MIDELPPQLRTLFEDEQRASRCPDAMRASIRARVLESVGVTATGTAAAAGLTTKIILGVFVAAAIGAGAMITRDRGGHPTPRAAALNLDSPSTELPEPPPVIERAVVSPPPAMAAPSPASTSDETAALPVAVAVPQSAVPDERPPSDEAALLAKAWAALLRNEPDLALTLVGRAELTHPTGALTEEAEALRISALAKLGRIGEAQLRADQFIDQYPKSIHRQRVERVRAME
jgi:hypothetical protein